MIHKIAIMVQPNDCSAAEFSEAVQNLLNSVPAVGTPKITPTSDAHGRQTITVQWTEHLPKDILAMIPLQDVMDYFSDKKYLLLDRIGVEYVKEYFNLVENTENKSGISSVRTEISAVIKLLGVRARRVLEVVSERCNWQYTDQINDGALWPQRNCGRKTVREILALRDRYKK